MNTKCGFRTIPNRELSLLPSPRNESYPEKENGVDSLNERRPYTRSGEGDGCTWSTSSEQNKLIDTMHVRHAAGQGNPAGTPNAEPVTTLIRRRIFGENIG
jgi:hypothetical protein